MFFDDNLVKCETLGKVWQVAHRQNDHEIGEVCLPEICQDLDTWVSSEDVVIRNRLSLRTSATLIGGAARIYKQKIDELFQNVQNLDNELITRRRRKLFVEEHFIDSLDTQPSSTPEEMKRMSEFPSDINNSNSLCKAKKRKISTPKEDHSFSSFSDASSIRIENDTAILQSSSITIGFISQKSSSDNGTDRNSNDKTESPTNSCLGSKRGCQTSNSEKSISQISSSSTELSNNRNVKTGSSLHFCPGSKTGCQNSKSGKSLTQKSSSSRSTELSINRNSNEKTGSSLHSCSGSKKGCQTLKSTTSVTQISSSRTTELTDNRSGITESSGKKTDENSGKKKKTTRTQAKDQSTQISRELHSDILEGEIDKSLPFGYLIIHNDYESRIPSKIVISSFNPFVKNM